VYRWELDGPAQQQFADLNLAVRASLAAFMDAVVIVDPVQYQRLRDERDDVSMPLRTLHFGPHDTGLVTFLVYPPDDLVLVVRIQWLGD
jgi:hypothetical protein